jgi:CubicO group peptidase (beta-lactamase class C family)
MASVRRFGIRGLVGFGAVAVLGASPLAGQTTLVRPPAVVPDPGALSPTAELPAVRDAIAVADLWIRERLAYFAIPGVAVAVVHGGETVWAAGYGLASLETGEPVSPSTRFRVGSVSKLFTATAVMMLRDEGKLALSDPVAKHLPWFTPKSPDPAWPRPTVEQLLTHTSGLPRDTSIPYWTTHDFPTAAAVRATIPSLPLLSYPGESYRYSNLGIAIAGDVVAAASGESWASFVDRRILAPLGMSSSRAEPPAAVFTTIAPAYLHRMPDGSRSPIAHYETRALSPAASVVSTAADLARFAAFHLAASGAADGAGTLAAASRREMQRVRFVHPSWTGGRGLGFGVSRRDGRTYPSHAGWIGGHRTDLLLDPSRNLAVVVLTNADDASPGLFSRKLLELVGGAVARATAKVPPPKFADSDWQRFVGRYTDPWGWEYEVLVLDGGLVFYEHDYPPDEDPEASITRLTPVGPTEFRMDDGEPVVFETDAAGKVTRVRRRFDYLTPLR